MTTSFTGFSSIVSIIMAFITMLTSVFTSVSTGLEKKRSDFPVQDFEEKADDCLRIMSFNVRCANVGTASAASRHGIVAETIEKGHPDSVGVQEATPEWMNALKKRLGDEYAYVGVGRDDGDNDGEYSAVFYLKDKYEPQDSGTFWLSETPEVPSKGWDAACTRICSYALLEDKQTGTRFAHANSHFDHVGEVAQQKEAEQVSAFVRDKFADVPCVFTADMNVLPTSEPYRIMTASLRDAAVTCADSVKRGTFHNAHPDKITDSTIDYVLYAGAWEPVHFRTVTVGIDDRFVSDHFPVYADMKLK